MLLVCCERMRAELLIPAILAKNQRARLQDREKAQAGRSSEAAPDERRANTAPHTLRLALCQFGPTAMHSFAHFWPETTVSHLLASFQANHARWFAFSRSLTHSLSFPRPPTTISKPLQANSPHLVYPRANSLIPTNLITATKTLDQLAAHKSNLLPDDRLLGRSGTRERERERERDGRKYFCSSWSWLAGGLEAPLFSVKLRG